MIWRRVANAGVICLLAIMPCDQKSSAAWASFATEKPWASEHITKLPPDIRREVAKREQACGNKAAAAHYFAVSIEAQGQRFISLHFEDFACVNRPALCNQAGCLHEIYTRSPGSHRKVFSNYALDVKMTNNDGIAGLEVNNGAAIEFFRWNGRTFVPAGKSRNGI